jgi:hypothetical protein
MIEMIATYRNVSDAQDMLLQQIGEVFPDREIKLLPPEADPFYAVSYFAPGSSLSEAVYREVKLDRWFPKGIEVEGIRIKARYALIEIPVYRFGEVMGVRKIVTVQLLKIM